MKTTHHLNFLILVITNILFWSNALAQEIAGNVSFVKGEAWVQQGLAKRPLKEGSYVYEGDQLRTGKKSNLYIKFIDQTFFSLGPEAGMNIETFKLNNTNEEGFVANILKGAFRFVSGLLAKKKPESVKFSVTVATIGIRGTDVAGEVFERHEKDGVVVEASARVSLLKDEEGRDTSIEVSNEYGSVLIDKPGYGTEIPNEHSPPGPVRRMQIRAVNNLLRAIRNAPRNSTTQRLRLP